MDKLIVDYLLSGEALIFLGTGPSNEMGYPSWRELAEEVRKLASIEVPNLQISRINKAIDKQDYPAVFEEAFSLLGGDRVISHLHEKLVPTGPSRIYKAIAQWPVRVFLTTNYDDELHNHLAKLGESYLTYSNSEDHLAYLEPGLNGAIFKLHGDLRSQDGLILTKSQYASIEEGDDWEFWRTKLTSVFQMFKVIVIGHSLSDPNIKHILSAAKRGAGVQRPVCWLCPDIDDIDLKREYLEKYRIRVISYDNRDGTHRNLMRLIENISLFVYPRTSVHIRSTIRDVVEYPSSPSDAAPGIFIFNKLAQRNDFDEYRVDIVCTAVQSVVSKLPPSTPFKMAEALELAGWPEEVPLPLELEKRVAERAISTGLLIRHEDKYIIGKKALQLASTDQRDFEHSRERFQSSVILRLMRDYPELEKDTAVSIAAKIESNLVKYFKEGGLTLASVLFSSSRAQTSSRLPSSIIGFIREASAMYSDLLSRQAFFTTSVGLFTAPEDADTAYLGRIAQGYFAFHALGLFGDAAIARLQLAKETIWLIDSSAQIPALALTSGTSAVFRDSFQRFKSMGVRLFTTERIFDETREHLWFANRVIEKHGETSPYVIYGARGEPPYRKANQFLEGFLRWQAAGNPADWEGYLIKALGREQPEPSNIREKLSELGIEVVSLETWPGYVEADQVAFHEITREIVRFWEERFELDLLEDSDFEPNFHKKAEPEAEVFLIIRNERSGSYSIISTPGVETPAWFVSQTSMLNLIEQGTRITWQPDAFLRFTSTLAPSTDRESADKAFQILLLGFSQAGLSLLSDKTIEIASKGIIDQAGLQAEELNEIYERSLSQKYSESPRSIIKRMSPAQRPLAVIQLASEIAEAEYRDREIAEERARKSAHRATEAESKLSTLQSVELKIKERRRERARKARQRKAKAGRKKKGK